MFVVIDVTAATIIVVNLILLFRFAGAWSSRNSSIFSNDTTTTTTVPPNGTTDGQEISPLQAKFANMISLPPRYVGAMSQLVDPMLGQVTPTPTR